MTAHFDPLDYAQQLENTGVPRAQADVHARTLAHVVDDCVAVPADLAATRHELTHQISETDMGLRAVIAQAAMRLHTEIAHTEMRLGTAIAETEMRLRKEIAETASKVERALRGELQAVEARLNSRISALEKEITSLRTEMRFHRWATGATFVLLAGIYFQLLFR